MNDIQLPPEKLQELGVSTVYLFGSQAENTSGKLSDIDVGVIFDDPKIAYDTTGKIYTKLYDIFTDAFDMNNFKDIDIVFLQKTSLELRYNAIKTRKILFESSKNLTENFEHQTTMLYADFYPLLADFNKQVLEKV